MKTVLKYTSQFLSLVMLVTSCYVSRPPSEQTKEVETKDLITVVVGGEEYKNVKVRAITDSTISIMRNGSLYEINKSQIESIEQRKMDPVTTAVLGISIVVVINMLIWFNSF